MDWAKLKLHVKNNNCLPVVGAGASRPHIPPAKDMAAELLRIEKMNTGDRDPFTDDRDQPLGDSEKRTLEDLAAVAEYLTVIHADGRYPKYVIAELVKNKCANPLFGEHDPHQALAALELPIYVTTNYDNRMRLALESRKKTVETAFCRWNEDLQKPAYTTCLDRGFQPTREKPIVFHLHGQMEIPESIVASEDDYLDFLAEMALQRRQDLQSDPTRPGARVPVLPPAIQNALATNLLLFVGYGVADTNFRVILRLLKTSLPSSRTTSITVQYGGGHREEVRQYLKQYFQWMLDLDVFWGSSEDFAKELTGKYNGPHG